MVDGLSVRGAALAVLEGDHEIGAMLELWGAGGALTTEDESLPLVVAKTRHAEARASPRPRRSTPRTAALVAPDDVGAHRHPHPDRRHHRHVHHALRGRRRAGAAAHRRLDRLGVAGLTSLVTAFFGDGVLGRTLLWGVDGGILATLAVGIPYILTFYFILAFVEDSGYMNAAAFLSDRVMHRFGLHGRAVIPLIAAGGCNVPAIIGTRSLSSTCASAS